MDTPLSPYIALDLTDLRGFLCGKVLADLGADVIKIEKSGGDPARKIAPFYHDIPDPEKSLYWFACNANKRGITLDIEKPKGKKLLKELVKQAHFVIESFDVGYMDSLHLGYKSLSRVNPQIIMTSISPFGQTGPYSKYQATDLIAMAMGGVIYITGEPDRPPVRISHPQTYFHTACHGAVGTLLANHYRQSTGVGQQVDVSMQEAIVRNLVMEPGYWEFAGTVIRRLGVYAWRAGSYSLRETWPCKDGQVCYRIMGGAFSRSLVALVKWMKEENMAGALGEVNLDKFDLGKVTAEQGKLWEGLISRFFQTHTKLELLDGALVRGIYLTPSNTTKDLIEDEQLAFRGAFVELEHPELCDKLKYPGYPAHLSETPATLRRRAPLIGEHNKEIYGGMLGLTDDEMKSLAAEGVI